MNGGHFGYFFFSVRGGGGKGGSVRAGGGAGMVLLLKIEGGWRHRRRRAGGAGAARMSAGRGGEVAKHFCSGPKFPPRLFVYIYIFIERELESLFRGHVSNSRPAIAANGSLNQSSFAKLASSHVFSAPLLRVFRSARGDFCHL